MASRVSDDAITLQAVEAFNNVVVPAARAGGTFHQYLPVFKKFKQWCMERNLQYLPAEPRTVALYLTVLFMEASANNLGPGTILSASSAVYCFHFMSGLDSPTTTPVCKVVRESAKRCLRAGANAKDGVSASMVNTILSTLLNEGPGRPHFIAAAISLLFYGFMRFDEVSWVRWDVIRFFPDRCEIFIEKKKTDQHLEGSWIPISRAPSGVVCPVRLFECLVEILRPVDGLLGGFLIRTVTARPIKGGFTVSKCHDLGVPPISKADGQRLRIHPPGCPSYSTVNNWVQERVRLLDSSLNIGTHSLRIGATTDSFSLGVPDWLIRDVTGWKSVATSDRYNRTSSSSKSSVSAKLMAYARGAGATSLTNNELVNLEELLDEDGGIPLDHVES